MTWDVLPSRLDRSVNFVRATPDGGAFEARFVCRGNDYAIAYLSSHSGCRMACRFCHLTQSRQTMFAAASHDDLLAQLRRVLQHIDDLGITVPRLHVNFMARGEPLANQALTADFARFANPAAEEAAARGMDLRFNISTIFPRDQDFNLEAAFGNFPVTIFWSLWSLDPGFRRRWMPRAECPKRSLARLVQWQAATAREVVLHWGLVAGQNDRSADLDAITDFLENSGLKARLNLVRYNSWSERTGREAEERRYAEVLAALSPWLTVPGSRIVPRVGQDIKASCGMFQQV